MMLCEIIPEASALRDFLMVLAFLTSLGVSVMTLLRLQSKQKREVSFAEEYVKRQELESVTDRLDRLEQQVDTIRDEMKQDKTDILKAGEERALKLHERINLVLTTVSELRGEVHARRMDI